MAIYDINVTRSFYSELGNLEDVCYYCEKKLKERRSNKEITHDQLIKEHRNLVGKLENIRVAKMKYLGHEICICPNCLKSIVDEVIPTIATENANINKEEVREEETNDAISIIEEKKEKESAADVDKKTKNKTTGKNKDK